MKKLSLFVATALLGVVTGVPVALAQAPAGSTGTCKDGTYTSAEKKSGACAGHKGVKDWYATDKKVETKAAPAAMKAAPATAAAAAPSAGAMTAPPKAAATAPAMAPATPAAKTAKTTDMPKEAAAGGGPGKVWVNTSSKVYHCMGDEYYGKTKEGAYMSEADAKAKGAHASHGKACS
jgi:hypothetical protein